MISAVDITLLSDAMPVLLGPPLPTLLGNGMPVLLGDGLPVLLGNGLPTLLGNCLGDGTIRPNRTAMAWATFLGLTVVGVGLAAIHGNWAYGDWTCAFKQCVAVAPVRRRRKRR